MRDDQGDGHRQCACGMGKGYERRHLEQQQHHQSRDRIGAAARILENRERLLAIDARPEGIAGVGEAVLVQCAGEQQRGTEREHRCDLRRQDSLAGCEHERARRTHQPPREWRECRRTARIGTPEGDAAGARNARVELERGDERSDDARARVLSHAPAR